MNIILQTSERTLVSLSSEELVAITNALNEVCNGVAISDSEFPTRLGADREFLQSVLKSLTDKVDTTSISYETVNVWADQCAVMVRAVTAFGDPVEMGEAEVSEFSARLQKAMSEVS